MAGAVCVSGTVLSSLIFKLRNAAGDAEGFLLGEVRRHSVKNITDSQSSGTREEKRTFIQSFVCLHEKHSFYDNYGRPDMGKIEAILGDQQKQVVGWFSYRRNSSSRLSLRERALHWRLMEAFPGVLSRDFLLGLVTEQALEQSTVHSTEYTFYQWIGTSPQLVQLNVINLRASAAIPYHTLPLTQLPSSLNHYSTVLQEHRSTFLDSAGHMLQAEIVERLYRSMVTKLEPLQSELASTTVAVVALGSEVARLQEEVNAIQEESQREEETGGMDEHAVLLQSPEPAGPIETGILIDLSEDEVTPAAPPPDLITLESPSPLSPSPHPFLPPTDSEGLVLMNPNVIDLNIDGGGESGRSSATSDSFPQQSQELF